MQKKKIFSSLQSFAWDTTSCECVFFLPTPLVSPPQRSSRTLLKFQYLYSPPNWGEGGRLWERNKKIPFLFPFFLRLPGFGAHRRWWEENRAESGAEGPRPLWSRSAGRARSGAAPRTLRAYKEPCAGRVLIPAPASAEWTPVVAVGFGFASLRRGERRKRRARRASTASGSREDCSSSLSCGEDPLRVW